MVLGQLFYPAKTKWEILCEITAAEIDLPSPGYGLHRACDTLEGGNWNSSFKPKIFLSLLRLSLLQVLYAPDSQIVSPQTRHHEELIHNCNQ